MYSSVNQLGVVRVENLHDPTEFIPAVLERVKPEYIQRTYDIISWKDASDFLSQLAVRTGKLLPVGVLKYHMLKLNRKENLITAPSRKWY